MKNENMKKEIYNKVSDLEKKFLKQKKIKNFELYKEYNRLKALKHFYNFTTDIKEIQKQKEKWQETLKEVKKLDIKEKKEKPLKPISKNDISAYNLKLYKIVDNLFNFLIDKKDYAYMFKPNILNELKLYLKDLSKIFEFKYYRNENLISIRIMDLNKCIEIKEILKN